MSADVVVNKAEQTITWSTPAPIVFGTLLGSGQLNATVAVIGPALAGALTYAPPAGTVLNAGDRLLSVTAAATNDYNSATKSVRITVKKATPAFSGLSSLVIAKGAASTTLSGHISAPGGESVSITLNGTTHAASIGGDGNFSSAFATGALAVAATPYPIVYSYAGDSNFNAITGAGTLTVAYVDTVTGTISAPAVDNDNGNRPFLAKFAAKAAAGSIPGDLTAFVNYTPSVRGANVTCTVLEGTWKLHADNKKPLPKGTMSGRIAGGSIQWNADGTKATVALQMTIDKGNGDFAGVTGTATFGALWDSTTTPDPTISGQLLIFY